MRIRMKADHFVETKSQNRAPPPLLFIPLTPPPPQIFGWVVVLDLTALSDSISVYIGPSPREREKEERADRGE